MSKISIKFILISFVIIAFFFFYFLNEDFVDSIPESEKPVWSLSLQIAKEFKGKYNLNFIGLGQSVDAKFLKTLDLSFMLDKILNKDEGRKLVLKCAKELLNNINDFKDIQPFLADHPFLEKNLGITIYFHKDQKHTTTIYPDICCISLTDGLIFYRIRDPNPPHLYKFSEEETIEEAKRIASNYK